MELYSDSKYVIDALQKGWAKGWRARGWIKSDKNRPSNLTCWEALKYNIGHHPGQSCPALPTRALISEAFTGRPRRRS